MSEFQNYIETKLCRGCHEIKIIDEFRFHEKGYRENYCDKCSKSKRKTHSVKNTAREKIIVAATKRCPTCQETKPSSHFTKSKSNTDGLVCYCKTCNSNYSKNHRNKRKNEWPIDQKLRQMTNSAKSRAKKNNIPFSISWENLTEVYKGICPILGLPLDWHSSKIMTDNSPSLDKIIPETGYAKGNIQIISWKANKMKNNATSEELNNFAKWVLKC